MSSYPGCLEQLSTGLAAYTPSSGISNPAFRYEFLSLYFPLTFCSYLLLIWTLPQICLLFFEVGNRTLNRLYWLCHEGDKYSRKKLFGQIAFRFTWSPQVLFNEGINQVRGQDESALLQERHLPLFARNSVLAHLWPNWTFS